MKHMIDDIEIYQDWKPVDGVVTKDVRDSLEIVTDCNKVGLTLDTGSKTIHINGVKLVNCQAVYGKLKELWKRNAMGLMAHNFPMTAITWVLFQMEHGWKITNPEMLVFKFPDKVDMGLRNNG